MRSLRKQGDALYRQEWTNWRCCVCGRAVMTKLEGSSYLQFLFKLASPQTVQDFNTIFLIHCDTKWLKFFTKYPARIEKKMMIVVLICLCEFPSVFGIVACAIPHSATWFQGRIRKNQLSSPVTAQVKKIWFSFEPFKHFRRHFVSTHFLIVVKIFWNHLCTHLPHVQTLCNNLVDVYSLIVSSSAIIRIVKRRSWRMKVLTLLTFALVPTEVERPYRVHLPPFLAHLQSLRATECLSTR
jgi:hypothetical protein